MAAPMNRAQKRMLQKQGALGADGQPQRAQPQQRRPPGGRPPGAGRPEEKEGRTGPRQFLKEVRGELRKVAWPTRSEVVNYSIIVLVAIVVLTTFIAVVDFFASEFVLNLFDE
jgi:preprotein translocase subunit SecE